MDSQARTLGRWTAELVALAAHAGAAPTTSGSPDVPDGDQEQGSSTEPTTEPSTPAQVAVRLVHLLRDSLGRANGDEEPGEGDSRPNREAALDVLGSVLADPDDEAAQAELAHLVDEQAEAPGFRVEVESLLREAWDARLVARREGPVGICVSGGGVRAASFGLGALQALQKRKQLLYGPERADYLAAVSGGSYTAGAITMLASRYGSNSAPLPQFDGDDHPFAPGTPEVEHVRRRARYLLGGGLVESVLQFFLRLCLNLVYLAVVIFIVARPAGWIYGWSLPDLARADQLTANELDLEPLVVPTALGLMTALAGVFVVFLTTIWRTAFNIAPYRVLRYGLLWTGAALFVLGYVVPIGLELIAEQWYVEPTTEQSVEETAGQSVEEGDQERSREVVDGVPEAALPWAGFSALASAAAAIASFKAVIPDEVGRTLFSRRFRPLLMRLLRLLIALAAIISVPVLIVTFASTTMIGGALGTTNWVREAVLISGAVGGLLFIAWLRDPMIWSLHPFYKSRLMSCFNVMRDPGSRLGARQRPPEPRYLLSQSAPPELPTLLVCAAANVSGFGNAPAGHNVLPFVLSPQEIGFTDVEGRMFPTRDLEQAVKGKRENRNITLPTAIAITGAAFSPSMGKMTISQIRMLMTVLNLRLGIWLPNPRNDDVWNAVVNEQRLPVRPTPWYLIKEALGLNLPDSRLIYVSDGGHYENLGLVELLRRGCRRIWCIDASGDQPGQINTLTEAMLLAESELGVRWTDSKQLEDLRFDKETTEHQRDRLATVRETHATLLYTLPDGNPGAVTVVKTGITGHTPHHLSDYQRRYPSFPYDSTVNQLFRADRFDAYVSLGYHSTNAALATLDANDPIVVRGTPMADISQTADSEM